MNLPMAKRLKTRTSPEPRPISTIVLEDDLVHKLTPTPQTTSKPPMALKGRRRFIADLNAVSSDCENGLEVQGLRVEGLKSGEEEGSILCTVVRTIDSVRIVALNLTVPDTSEYPENHYFICFAQDHDVPSYILNVIETIIDQGSRTIEQIVKKVLTLLAKKQDTMSKELDTSDAEDAEEYEDEDLEMYENESYADDDDDVMSLSAPSLVQAQTLTRDFIEIIAAGYHPGRTLISADELVLSVSVPGFTLADMIPPRALMAWDPRILDTARHLTLIISGTRGVYPLLEANGRIRRQALDRGAKLRFKIGLSKRYKPAKEYLLELARSASLLAPKRPAQEPVPERSPSPMFYSDEEDEYDPMDFHAPYRALVKAPEEEEVETETDHDFVPLSLSASLEPLLNDRFLDILRYRVKFNIGWAGAEIVDSEVHRLQKDADTVFQETAEKVELADVEEAKLLDSYRLPPDPLEASDRDQKTHLNLPFLAFSYLLRRLTLCSKFCLICYERVKLDFEALRPYVCENKLCTYQYYSLNRGPSLEYEICTRPRTIDLLVSLAYVAAAHTALEDFPDGMNIMVVPPSKATTNLVEFDSLTPAEKQQAIVELLNVLPPIDRMKRHLETRAKGAPVPVLKDMDHEVPPAAWHVLRWCVASCTSYLEELTNEADLVGHVGSSWMQFRFTVGAPSAEAQFASEREKACAQDANARQYPSLYAFHGSPVKNWHSIIRHGLWYKTIANGRAYGNGVYFAKDAHVSLGSYSQITSISWPNSFLAISSCAVLAEIVNLPQNFVSTNPYFVVQRTDWIVCRYLLVKTGLAGVALNPHDTSAAAVASKAADAPPPPPLDIPKVPLDPRHPLTIGAQPITIPSPTHRLSLLLEQRKSEHTDEGYDEEDQAILCADHVVTDDVPQSALQAEEDWMHDPDWVQRCVSHMLPAPMDASRMATTALQRELTAIIKEQAGAQRLKELGWYMPQEFMDDNLFQWVVELHSFDPDLPIAKDLAAKKINSLVFEIRFPDNYPHAPPFFRLLMPRFLPFIQGGGGHVTGGGSMCMDLLTADGWLPSYNIPAVLLQIKMAISNLDPRPARLASNWDVPYTMQESLEGFRRAAQTHGWRVPTTLDKLSVT